MPVSRFEFKAFVVAVLAVTGTVRAVDKLGNIAENRITISGLQFPGIKCNSGCGRLSGTGPDNVPIPTFINNVFARCLSEPDSCQGAGDDPSLCLFSCTTHDDTFRSGTCSDAPGGECPSIEDPSGTLDCSGECALEGLFTEVTNNYCQYNCPRNRVLGLGDRCSSNAECAARPDVYETSNGFRNGCILDRELLCGGVEDGDENIQGGFCQNTCVPKPGVCGGDDSGRCKCSSSRGCTIPE